MSARYWIAKGELLTVLREQGHPAVRLDGETFAWSNRGRLPSVGEVVNVLVNDFGESKVVSYFVENGFYGLIVEPTVLPGWYVRQNKGTEREHPLRGWNQVCVFGAEIAEVQR